MFQLYRKIIFLVLLCVSVSVRSLADFTAAKSSSVTNDNDHAILVSSNPNNSLEKGEEEHDNISFNTGRKLAQNGDFSQLSCNNNLVVDDCSNSSKSISLSTLLNSANGAEVLVPCGTCAYVDVTDFSTLVFPAGLNIEGMLYFDASANVTIKTTHVFIQGILRIEHLMDGNKINILMTGDMNNYLYPHSENNVCDATSGCDVGKRAVVVAGGVLEVAGHYEDTTCANRTHVRQISSPSSNEISVESAVASCWKNRGSDPEILITNLRVKEGVWHHKYRVISSIDDSNGTLTLTKPVDATPINDILSGYTSGVQWLSRPVKIDSEGDGGTFIDYGTPNVQQRLEGVEIRNFDPNNFTTMSGSIAGTTIRKNVGPKFNNRSIVTRNPFLPLFSRRQGNSFISQNGVIVKETGVIGSFGNNDYLIYDYLNFGPPGTTNAIRIMYSKGNNDGGSIEARLGNQNGNLIGTFYPTFTGAWRTYEEGLLYIEANGVHQLSLRGVGPSGVLNMDWFELTYSPTPSPSESPSEDPANDPSSILSSAPTTEPSKAPTIASAPSNAPTITTRPTAGFVEVSEDAYIRDTNYTNTNHGSETVLYISNNESSKIRKAVLKFITSTFFSNLGSVILKLYVHDIGVATSRTLTLKRLGDNSWSESNITWANMDHSTYLVTQNVIVVPSDLNKWISVDVTDLLAISDGTTASIIIENNGASGGSVWVRFGSRESLNVPKLVW